MLDGGRAGNKDIIKVDGDKEKVAERSTHKALEVSAALQQLHERHAANPKRVIMEGDIGRDDGYLKRSRLLKTVHLDVGQGVIMTKLGVGYKKGTNIFFFLSVPMSKI